MINLERTAKKGRKPPVMQPEKVFPPIGEDVNFYTNGKPPETSQAAQALMDIFFRGTVHHAQSRVKNGVLSYEPVEGNPTAEKLAAHLTGEACLGSYTLLPDSTVNWICLDVDSTDLGKARNIAADILDKLAFANPVIEFSGNKGYHIWLFLTQAVQATRAKAFGVKIRELVGAPSSGDPHVEIFPKQEKLTLASPMGNLVKLPLGVHPKSKKRSVFCRVGTWESEPIEDPLPLLLQRVDFEAIENALEEATPSARLVQLLAPYWTDGGRHELCLCLSGYLGNMGWKLDDCLDLVNGLIDNHGGEETNLNECVTDTYRKIAEGAKVKGFSGLAEILPTNLLRTLTEIVSDNMATPVMQLIDRVRLDKLASYLKVKAVAALIFPDLTETGRFIQPTIGEGQYWFERSTHRLWDCASPEWKTRLFKNYGIIIHESFYAQVYEALEHLWSDSSVKLPIYHRSHWDGQILWLNLGDERIYRLDGEKITLTYNGEGDLLFRAESDGPCSLVPDLLGVTPVNPWDYLTNLLSFAPKDGVTGADPEEQRHMLQAYLLSMAFGELAKTKPIGGILGPRGSGKTSASRNIGRIWNKPYDDVLGVADDKPDGFRASLEHAALLVMDNLETSTAKWLAHIMSKISTGAQIELKTLYKTNAKYVIRPHCYLMFSAIELPEALKTDALASRILPLQLDILRNPQSESFFQQRLYDNYAGIWAGLAAYLNQCIPLLRATKDEWATAEEIRLADFANFCRRIRDLPPTVVDYKLVQSGLRNLSKQQEQLAPVSPFLQALEAWVSTTLKREDHTEARTLAELFPILHKIAQSNQIEWRWKDAQALSRHVKMLEQRLQEDYGCTLGETRNKKGKTYTTYAFDGGH